MGLGLTAEEVPPKTQGQAHEAGYGGEPLEGAGEKIPAPLALPSYGKSLTAIYI